MKKFFDGDISNKVLKEEIEKMTVDELIDVMRSSYIYSYQKSKLKKDRMIKYILDTRRNLCLKFGKVV